MRIDVLTLFPEMFASPLNFSIVKRAQQRGLVQIALSNIRDFAKDSYKKVDDKPYGGGAGMVLMCQPVFDCLEHVKKLDSKPARIILLTPQGKKLDQGLVKKLAKEKKLVLGLLAHFPCVTALKTAESLLSDPAVAAEAKLAADRIRQALK